MRTEDDIREALDMDIDIEADARAVHRLLSFAGDLEHDRGARPDAAAPHRRPVRLLAVAAAAVLVAGAAVGLAEWQHHPDRGVTTGEQGGLSAAARRPTWNLRIGPVPGYRFTRVSASSIGRATGSLFSVVATNAKSPERGTITTCPGRSLAACADTTAESRVRHVTVDGRPGVVTGLDNAGRLALSWFAGHGTVVFLYGSFGLDPVTHRYDHAVAQRRLLRIAAAVTAGHHDPARLPFALDGLPGRVAPESVLLGAGACSDYGVGPVSDDNALGTVFTACRVPTGTSRSATIRAADRVRPDRDGEVTGSQPDAIVVHDFADSTSIVVSIGQGQSKIVSAATAARLAARADVSPDLGDRSTWLVVGG